MEQNNLIDSVKTWLEAQTPFVRGLATVGGLVVASAILVAIICMIGGWTEPKDVSNALFYAASVMFAVSLVVYFGQRRPLIDSEAEEENEEDEEDEPGPKGLLIRRRQPRDIPFYAVAFITAGVVLFLLSIGWYYMFPS